MIRKFEGDEVVEKLNKAVSEVFLNESKSLNLLIDFFSLLKKLQIQELGKNRNQGLSEPQSL